MIIPSVFRPVLVRTGSVDRLEKVVFIRLCYVVRDDLRCCHNYLAIDVWQEEPEQENGGMITVPPDRSRQLVPLVVFR